MGGPWPYFIPKIIGTYVEKKTALISACMLMLLVTTPQQGRILRHCLEDNCGRKAGGRRWLEPPRKHLL